MNGLGITELQKKNIKHNQQGFRPAQYKNGGLMKNIQEFVSTFFARQISDQKCWQCKHFVKDKGKGVNGCDIDPHSFDNGWRYIPATYKANDPACVDFELKQEIREHLNL